MKVEIIGKNYEVSEKLKDVTSKKLGRLDKYFEDGDTAARVVFKKESNDHIAEVSLLYAGRYVRATAKSENFYDDLDAVLPKLEGQIRKYRTKFDKHMKNKAYKEDVVFEGAANVEKSEKKELVKEKSFILTPMTMEEAAEEMELLGHSFYVYLDAKTDEIKVLYIRNDGNLGLIEPQRK